MPWLRRPEIKVVVLQALNEVADFEGEFQVFGFSKFHKFHKQVFINVIASELSKKGFGVTLSIKKLNTLGNIRELVDHIEERQVFKGEPEAKVSLP